MELRSLYEDRDDPDRLLGDGGRCVLRCLVAGQSPLDLGLFTDLLLDLRISDDDETPRLVRRQWNELGSRHRAPSATELREQLDVG